MDELNKSDLLHNAAASAGVALGNAEGMTPLEQAAILLLCMGEEPASAVLRCLSREELLAVTQEMSSLSGIKVDAVKTSIQKFFDEYREQSGVHGASRAFLKRSLDLALGSDIANSVLNNIYGDAIRPKMARLQWVSPKWLADRIAGEHVRMQAVFLAFLPPAMASQVLECIPREHQDELLYRIANLSEVNGEVIAELGELIERSLAVLSTQGAQVRGVKQAADIMNRFKGNRDQMFELLRAHDEDLVGKIEEEMYDFFILSKQSNEVLETLLEAIPLEEWVVALKGAEPALVKAVQGAMPKRQAQQMDAIKRRQGPVPISRIEQVRKDIMAVVRDLAAQGDIQLQLFREQTVE